MTSEGLHGLDESECYAFLHSRTLGRIGVRIGDQISILPVYYALMDRDVVFRTSPGTKLSAALLGARVVFEVDNGSPGWSVVVRGHAHEIREPADLVHAESLLGHDWPAGEREHYVRIVTEQVTGRRISSSA